MRDRTEDNPKRGCGSSLANGGDESKPRAEPGVNKCLLHTGVPPSGNPLEPRAISTVVAVPLVSGLPLLSASDTTVEVCRKQLGWLHMPGGHSKTITFAGKTCTDPGRGHIYYGARPIWVDFVIALLLLEALREVIQAVKSRFRRGRSGGSWKPRSREDPRPRGETAARGIPPSEQLLPGEDPSDLYGPSAPPQPSGRVRRARNPDDRVTGLPRPGDTFHDQGEIIPVQYVPARELVVGPDRHTGRPTCVHPRHKLNLGDVHRLFLSWERPPPLNLDP